MAAQIYGLERNHFLALAEEELSLEQSEQRRIGKNTVLGCGYQMGPERFRRQYLRHLPKDEATALAERIVYVDYRKNWAPLVPKLWRDLEQTARRAMLIPYTVAMARCGLSYQLETIAGMPCLVCRLLNGKRIHYMNARVSPDQRDPWGFPKWTYWAYRKGQWREIEPYGGQLTENAVQGLARELLVDAMFRLEERGYPLVLSVHDEIVAECLNVTKEVIEEIMSVRPQWAERLGVPVKVKAWVGRRYRK
jgi:DNA polymerase bacteriophage-type